MNEPVELPGAVQQALISYKRYRTISKALDVFSVNVFRGLLVALTIQAASFFVPIDNRLFLQAVALLFSLARATYISTSKKYTLLDCAIDADIQFDLKEKLSTTTEFVNKPVNEEILSGLIRDAIDSSKKLVAREGFRPLANNYLAMSIASFLLIIALTFVPNKMDSVLFNKRDLKTFTEVTKKQVDRFKKEIDSSKISERQKKVLLKELEKLLKDLKLATSKEDALAKLNKHEENLSKMLPPTFKRAELALNRMANNMAQEKSLSEIAKALQNRDGEKVNKGLSDLEKMALQNKLTSGQKAEIAQALQKSASQMEPLGQKELSIALNNLAQAIGSKDSSQLQQSINALNNSLSDQINNANMDQAISSMIARLSESKASMAGQGQIPNNQAAAGRSVDPSNSSNSSSQNGSGGKGTGKGSGAGKSGGGKGAGAGQGAIGAQGSANAGRSGAKPGLGIADAKRNDQLGSHENLFDPNFLNARGEKLRIAGVKGAGEEIQMGKSGTSRFGSTESALTPYSNLYSDYFSFTARAISRGEIPKSYEKLVLDYFSQINPDN